MERQRKTELFVRCKTEKITPERKRNDGMRQKEP